jgi:hypothetical protein
MLRKSQFPFSPIPSSAKTQIDTNVAMKVGSPRQKTENFQAGNTLGFLTGLSYEIGELSLLHFLHSEKMGVLPEMKALSWQIETKKKRTTQNGNKPGFPRRRKIP